VVECIFCRCERLTSTSDEPGLGDPIICGQCGSLMVLGYEEELFVDGDGAPTGGFAIHPLLRTPTRDESIELRQRDDVAALLAAYATVSIEGAFAEASDARQKAVPRRVRRKAERMSKPITLYGPDHPNYRG